MRRTSGARPPACRTLGARWAAARPCAARQSCRRAAAAQPPRASCGSGPRPGLAGGGRAPRPLRQAAWPTVLRTLSLCAQVEFTAKHRQPGDRQRVQWPGRQLGFGTLPRRAQVEYLLNTGNLGTGSGSNIDLSQASGFTIVAEKLNFFRRAAYPIIPCSAQQPRAESATLCDSVCPPNQRHHVCSHQAACQPEYKQVRKPPGRGARAGTCRTSAASTAARTSRSCARPPCASCCRTPGASCAPCTRPTARPAACCCT